MRRLTFLLCVALLVSCTQNSKTDEASPVRVVSWGGKFQSNLIEQWVLPAAESDGIQIETEAWNGDYSALTTRIERNLNNWDIIHVESMYVMNPKYKELFKAYEGRELPSLINEVRADKVTGKLIVEGYAVPVLEYGYLIAGRNDNIEGKAISEMDWIDFWNVKDIPGKRGLRDFPVGNIEAALSSKGYDVKEYLYAEKNQMTITTKVKEALDILSELEGNVIWWKSGDSLQQGIESGDMTLAAAWSGRVLSASRSLCGDIEKPNPSSCVIDASAKSAFISTDWWIIPTNAPNARKADELLQALYSIDAQRGASNFSSKEGYAVPIQNLQIDDPIAKRVLGMGQSQNSSKIARIDEEFWSKNYTEVQRLWNDWRVRNQ